MKIIITIILVSLLIIVNGFVLWAFVKVGTSNDNKR